MVAGREVRGSESTNRFGARRERKRGKGKRGRCARKNIVEPSGAAFSRASLCGVWVEVEVTRRKAYPLEHSHGHQSLIPCREGTRGASPSTNIREVYEPSVARLPAHFATHATPCRSSKHALCRSTGADCDACIHRAKKTEPVNPYTGTPHG